VDNLLNWVLIVCWCSCSHFKFLFS
jgi:hypothetical protein